MDSCFIKTLSIENLGVRSRDIRVDIETDGGGVGGQSISIALDEITPHLRAFYLLGQYVYPTLRGAVHAGANGPTVGQLMHGKAPMQPSPLEDDLNLIRRVVGRDRQAFETLYHRYSPVVYRYLWKLIRQREIVEEALNDVMMVVWQTASRFNGTSRLSTWILGIAHNKALKARARSAQVRYRAPAGGALRSRVQWP